MKNLRVVYHGTNKKNAEIILKKGFKKNTYFALNLADALEFGGEYIFYVVLNVGDKNWQPRPINPIPKTRITRVIKVNPKIIYENDKVRIKFFGKGKPVPCPNCKEDIGRVKLSIFGKPTIPRCPKCKKTFKQLYDLPNRKT